MAHEFSPFLCYPALMPIISACGDWNGSSFEIFESVLVFSLEFSISVLYEESDLCKYLAQARCCTPPVAGP